VQLRRSVGESVEFINSWTQAEWRIRQTSRAWWTWISTPYSFEWTSLGLLMWAIIVDLNNLHIFTAADALRARIIDWFAYCIKYLLYLHCTVLNWMHCVNMCITLTTTTEKLKWELVKLWISSRTICLEGRIGTGTYN
jgi:hypothetical protein